MRKTVYSRTVLLVIALFSFICVPGLKGATSLPKFGFSMASDADAERFARIAADCKLKDAFVILPRASIILGSEGDSAFPAQEGIFNLMPPGSHLYLRLKVGFGSFSQKGKELESIVTLQIADVMKKLPLNNPLIEGLMVEVEGSFSSVELAQFALADIVVKGKARKSSLKTILSFPEDFIQKNAELVRRLASYYDALSPAYAPNWQETLSWISKQALNKRVFLRVGSGEESDPKRFASSYLDAVFAVADSSVDVLYVEQPSPDLFAGLCPAAVFLSQIAGKDFALTETLKTPFTVTAEGAARTETKVFATPSQDLGFMVKLETAGKPVSVYLHGPSSGQFETEWFDAIDNRKLRPGERTSNAAETLQSGVPGSSHTFILIRNTGSSASRLHSSVTVVAEADLTVEEVIARWQQYRESQNQLLHRYTSDCFTTLHLEGTLLGASGFDISMSLKEFFSQEAPIEWVQSDFYVNGVRWAKDKEFPLPQMEPEKVVSQPLELKLDEKYAYKLEGFDKVDDALCYVVSVEPKEQNASLYSGKVWIHATQFRHVKMELRQRGIKGNITSNIETQSFALVPDGKGNEFNLKKSIYAQQIMNAAGRDFVIQKTYSFSNYSINSDDFDASLTMARLSKSPMFRDTDTGLQTLKKQGDKRVLVDTGKRVRSLVAGLLYEGSFDFPIPLAGFSKADFNYRNTGAQLSYIFAGPVLAGNISKQWKSRYRLSVDFALSALPSNNRIFSGNRELKTEGFYTFHETTGFRATWQPTLNLSLTGSFYIAYDQFRTTGDTDKAFVLPRNGITLNPCLELKYARKGYLFNAEAEITNRVGWKNFGLPQDLGGPVRDQFDKYYATFTKDFYLGKFTKTGLSLAYYGGDRLDRISRFQTSFLSEPHIRGIPSGTDSFDNIALASAHYGFNILDVVKFEGSYNHAWARNKGESRDYKGFDGMQFDFGTVGPWATYLQGTMTYALAGNLDRYNSRWGAYLLIYKPLN
jgi:hypothetical protein